MTTEERLTEVEIRPGAWYVLTCPEMLSADDCRAIGEMWEREATGARLIILDGGKQLRELTDEEIGLIGARD